MLTQSPQPGDMPGWQSPRPGPCIRTLGTRSSRATGSTQTQRLPLDSTVGRAEGVRKHPPRQSSPGQICVSQRVVLPQGTSGKVSACLAVTTEVCWHLVGGDQGCATRPVGHLTGCGAEKDLAPRVSVPQRGALAGLDLVRVETLGERHRSVMPEAAGGAELGETTEHPGGNQSPGTQELRDGWRLLLVQEGGWRSGRGCRGFGPHGPLAPSRPPGLPWPRQASRPPFLPAWPRPGLSRPQKARALGSRSLSAVAGLVSSMSSNACSSR